MITDEKKVPAYKLPELLRCVDGAPVTDPQVWRTKRRPEILQLFAEHVYGHTPDRDVEVIFEIAQVDASAVGGRASRLQVIGRVRSADGKRKRPLHLLVYVPANQTKPAPVFCGLNFSGNHTLEPDRGIRMPEGWIWDKPGMLGLANNQATEESRGVAASAWPVHRIVERGYGLVTCYAGDLYPDHPDGYPDSIAPLFTTSRRTTPEPGEWGAVGAWAWGLSRMVDFIATHPDLDESKVGVIGHSRMGIAALWAGAQDERFALVIANESGCAGAALSRRRFGETVAAITTVFPQQFTPNFANYAGAEDQLRVDQHMLLATIAPRALHIGSAERDLWADPHGEFLACLNATPAFRLLGGEGLPATQMPDVGEPIHGQVSYHIRPGEHAISPDDWQHYLTTADRYLAQPTKTNRKGATNTRKDARMG